MQLKTGFKHVDAYRDNIKRTDNKGGKQLNFKTEIKKSLELFSFRCFLQSVLENLRTVA